MKTLKGIDSKNNFTDQEKEWICKIYLFYISNVIIFRDKVVKK